MHRNIRVLIHLVFNTKEISCFVFNVMNVDVIVIVFICISLIYSLRAILSVCCRSASFQTTTLLDLSETNLPFILIYGLMHTVVGVLNSIFWKVLPKGSLIITFSSTHVFPLYSLVTTWEYYERLIWFLLWESYENCI